MARTSTGIQYNARTMNGIVSINADEITCSGTITSDLIKANNLLEADTAETISGLWNFTTLPYSSVSAINGTDFTNLNSVNSAISSSLTGYVSISGNQTITGQKTFNANVRLPAGVSLILGATATGGRITHTAPHTFYDNLGGGNHYFQLGSTTQAFIDGNGISLEADKYLNFSGGSYLLQESAFDNLIYNVPTSHKHQFRVNNFDAVSISSDANGTLMTFGNTGTIMREYISFDWFLYQLPSGHTLKYQVGGNEIFEISSGGAIVYESLSMRDGKRLVWDQGFSNLAYLRKDTITNTFDYEVATGYKHKFMVNGAGIMCIDASGIQMGISTLPAVFPRIYTDYSRNNWITGDLTNVVYNCSANAGNGTHNFKRNEVDIAFLNQFALNMTTDNCALSLGTTSPVQVQHNSTTGLEYKSPSGRNHNFLINNVSSAIIDASGVIIQSTAVGGAGVPNKILYLSQNKANYIGSSTTDMRYNCATGGSHNFYQNNTTYLGFLNSTSMTLSPNNVSLQLGTTSTAQIKHDTATSQLQYRTLGSFNHTMYIDGTAWYEFRTDTFRALRGWQCKLGALGAYVSNNLNTSWNNPVGGLSCWIDTTRIGTFTISDYRVKEKIVPARPVLERLCQVRMIEYELKDISIFKKNFIHHGFIAHEIQEIFPELKNIVGGEKDALTDDGLIQPQSIQPEFTNLYLSAIQELNAKCIAQQAQMETMQKVIEDQQKQIDQLIVLFSQSRI